MYNSYLQNQTLFPVHYMLYYTGRKHTNLFCEPPLANHEHQEYDKEASEVCL